MPHLTVRCRPIAIVLAILSCALVGTALAADPPR